jgi:hypothetical protein
LETCQVSKTKEFWFMNPVIGQCPICHDTLNVTRLHCRNCDTTLEGHFTLGRLYQLSPEQLSFIETFVRCEGKINRVEQEIGMSYPAVRARLTEVIQAMGYEVGEPDPVPVSDETRREVLAELSAGTLNADEALQILRGGN